MDADSQQPKRRDGALSALNTAIEAMNLAKEVSSVTPAKAVFGSVSILLTMIRVRFLLPPPTVYLFWIRGTRTPWPTRPITSSSG